MLLLADYSSQDHSFEFDPDTGRYSRIKLPERRKDRAGYAGVGQLLHSPGQGKVFVAKYLLSGDAWFSVGAERWRLFDESLLIKHSDRVFRCELTIDRDGRRVRTFRYRRTDLFLAMLDPTYDYLDLDLAHLPVSFVPLEGQPLQEQKEEFVKAWSVDPASLPAATATIRLTRGRGGWDSRQRYQVMINGLEFGQIKSEGVFEYKLPPGRISLCLGILWQCASNTVEFAAGENSVTHLECGSNLRGWKIFRAHKVTKDRIWVRLAAV